MKHTSDQCGSSCDAPASFQIFQSIYHNIYAGIELVLFQLLADLFCIPPGISQRLCVFHRLAHGNGNPLVIHHLNLAVIVLRQQPGCLIGIGKSAGKRNVNNLIILSEHPVPEIRNLGGSRLRGGDTHVRVLKLLEKLRLRYINIFTNHLSVDQK